MKEATATRLASEVSFVLALLSGVLSLGSELGAMLALLGGILLFASIAVNVRFAVLRALLALLPGAAFFLTDSTALRIVIVIAVLYTALVLALGRFEVEYLSIKSVYKIMGILGFILLFTFIAKAVSTGEKADAGLLTGFFLFFILGIITLRTLRLNVALSAKEQLTNAGIVLFPALAGVGAFSFCYFVLVKLGPWILYPLGRFLHWLYSLTDHGKTPDKPMRFLGGDPSRHVASTELPPSAYKDAEEYLSQEDAMSRILHFGDTDVPWKTIVIVLAVILAIVLLILYLRLFRKGKSKKAVFEATETGDAPSRFHRAKKKESSAAKVRSLYREYLYFLRLKGVEIEEEETSQEILENSEKLFTHPAAKTLREIYIRARYGDEKSITAEDVSIAAECLRTLREEQK